MDAVASFLQALSAATPMVVVFEDMHAADPDSLVLFEFVARQLRDSRALLLGSYRATELHRPRVGNVIDANQARGRPAATGRAGARLGARIHPRRNGRAPARADRHGDFQADRRPSALSQGSRGAGHRRGGFRAIPATLATAIEERVAQLPPETQSLLGAASVLGRDLAVDALAELAEESDRLRGSASRACDSGAADRAGFAGAAAIRAHARARSAARRTCPPPPSQRFTSSARSACWTQGTGRESAALARAGPGISRNPGRSRVCGSWRRGVALPSRRTRATRWTMRRCARRAHWKPRRNPRTRRRICERTCFGSLASAQIRAGDLEAGRRNSIEAFSLAESPCVTSELMADAALTYGGIFTFGNVDRRLVRVASQVARCAERPRIDRAGHACWRGSPRPCSLRKIPPSPSRWRARRSVSHALPAIAILSSARCAAPSPP